MRTGENQRQVRFCSLIGAMMETPYGLIKGWLKRRQRDSNKKNRRRLFEQGFWVTKDGHKILVVEMDDNHLQNTIRMIEQAGQVRSPWSYPAPRGQHAQDAYYQECDAWDEFWSQMYGVARERQVRAFFAPIYAKLVAEAKRRHLRWGGPGGC